MEITVVEGDITQQDVDAVVNAANNAMRGGGGVDGAIHRAGGPAVLEDCVRRFPDGLATGDAGWTTAGDLPARWVIHVVGPNRNAGQTDRVAADLLLRPGARGGGRARRRGPSRSRWSAPASTAGPRTTRSELNRISRARVDRGRAPFVCWVRGSKDDPGNGADR